MEKFNYYMDSEAVVHDKTCGCSKNEGLTGITKITYSHTLHKRCRAFIYIRMMAGSKNTEKYFHWFKQYSIDSKDLRSLALDSNATCYLRGNRLFIDTKNDRWIIETNTCEDSQKARLYHCNYKRDGEVKTFNSSAYHEQFSYDKHISALMHDIATHCVNVK